MKEEVEVASILHNRVDEKKSIEAQRSESNQDEIRQVNLIEIDPSRCRPWKYHNRDSAWLTIARCRDLINSIKNSGQIEPALVRKIQDPNYNYEIIYGVRRWFACSKIPNKNLLARITEADDKTCMILMHAENANSKDITEFERACSFAQQMKSGLFKNQVEMAEILGVSQGTISKMLKAATIFEHDWIRELFLDKLEIPIKRAYALSVLLKKSKYYTMIKNEAENIKSEHQKTGRYFSPPDILKQLIQNTRMEVNMGADLVILRVDDKPVVSCRRDKFGKVSIVIETEAKTLNRNEVENACIKAIGDYIFKEIIPGE